MAWVEGISKEPAWEIYGHDSADLFRHYYLDAPIKGIPNQRILHAMMTEDQLIARGSGDHPSPDRDSLAETVDDHEIRWALPFAYYYNYLGFARTVEIAAAAGTTALDTRGMVLKPSGDSYLSLTTIDVGGVDTPLHRLVKETIEPVPGEPTWRWVLQGYNTTDPVPERRGYRNIFVCEARRSIVGGFWSHAGDIGTEINNSEWDYSGPLNAYLAESANISFEPYVYIRRPFVQCPRGNFYHQDSTCINLFDPLTNRVVCYFPARDYDGSTSYVRAIPDPTYNPRRRSLGNDKVRAIFDAAPLTLYSFDKTADEWLGLTDPGHYRIRGNQLLDSDLTTVIATAQATPSAAGTEWHDGDSDTIYETVEWDRYVHEDGVDDREPYASDVDGKMVQPRLFLFYYVPFYFPAQNLSTDPEAYSQATIMIPLPERDTRALAAALSDYSRTPGWTYKRTGDPTAYLHVAEYDGNPTTNGGVISWNLTPRVDEDGAYIDPSTYDIATLAEEGFISVKRLDIGGIAASYGTEANILYMPEWFQALSGYNGTFPPAIGGSGDWDLQLHYFYGDPNTPATKAWYDGISDGETYATANPGVYITSWISTINAITVYIDDWRRPEPAQNITQAASEGYARAYRLSVNFWQDWFVQVEEDDDFVSGAVDGYDQGEIDGAASDPYDATPPGGESASYNSGYAYGYPIGYTDGENGFPSGDFNPDAYTPNQTAFRDPDEELEALTYVPGAYYYLSSYSQPTVEYSDIVGNTEAMTLVGTENTTVTTHNLGVATYRYRAITATSTNADGSSTADIDTQTRYLFQIALSPYSIDDEDRSGFVVYEASTESPGVSKTTRHAVWSMVEQGADVNDAPWPRDRYAFMKIDPTDTTTPGPSVTAVLP